MKEGRLWDQKEDGLVKDVTALLKSLKFHGRNSCSRVNILNMGEAGISPWWKTTDERDERRIGVYSNPQTVVKENFIMVQRGLTKESGIVWSTYLFSALKMTLSYFSCLKFPCSFKYFSNNNKIIHLCLCMKIYTSQSLLNSTHASVDNPTRIL